MSNDALERLKNRQRPTVKTRDASLTSSSLDISIPRYLDKEDSEQLERRSSAAEGESQSALAMQISSSLDISTSGKGENYLKTKQSTLRLEIGISDRLSQLCKDNGISREVFIEALFQYYQADVEAWQQILSEAKKRADYRLEIANRKRAQSMMKRFNPSP